MYIFCVGQKSKFELKQYNNHTSDTGSDEPLVSLDSLISSGQTNIITINKITDSQIKQTTYFQRRNNYIKIDFWKSWSLRVNS